MRRKPKTKRPQKGAVIEFVDPATLRIPPEAAIVPRPTEKEREALRQDILKFDVRDPIDVLDNDDVVDGRTRLEIALEEKLPSVPIRRVTLGDGETLQSLMIKKAALRRQLKVGPWAILIAKLAKQQPKSKGGPRGQRHQGGVSRKGRASRQKALTEAAKAYGLPPRTVSNANELVNQAPDLAAEVEAGGKEFSAARKELKNRKRAKKALDAGAAPTPPEDTSRLDSLARKTKLIDNNAAFAAHRPKLCAILHDIPWALHEGVISWPLPEDFLWVDDVRTSVALIAAAGGAAASQASPPSVSEASLAASRALSARAPAPAPVQVPAPAPTPLVAPAPARVPVPTPLPFLAPTAVPAQVSVPVPTPVVVPAPVPFNQPIPVPVVDEFVDDETDAAEEEAGDEDQPEGGEAV